MTDLQLMERDLDDGNGEGNGYLEIPVEDPLTWHRCAPETTHVGHLLGVKPLVGLVLEHD